MASYVSDQASEPTIDNHEKEKVVSEVPDKTERAKKAEKIKEPGRSEKGNGATAMPSGMLTPLPPLDSGTSLDDPSLYINREVSWLAFNHRILAEAQDSRHPLLERVKFLSIFTTNLYEFFMVKVSGLKRHLRTGHADLAPDGLTPQQELAAIRQRVLALEAEQQQCWDTLLRPELAKHKIFLLSYSELNDRQREYLDTYFETEVFPVLTPLAFDPGHPFPHISNLSLNLAVVIRDADGDQHFARVKVPEVLPRLVSVPSDEELKSGIKAMKQTQEEDEEDEEDEEYSDSDSLPYILANPIINPGPWNFVWLEQIIALHLSRLFPGMTIVEAHPFHVIRDADLAIVEAEAEYLLETIEAEVSKRRFLSVVRLTEETTMPDYLRSLLLENLEADADDAYAVKGPLALGDLMTIYERVDRPDLKYLPFIPRIPAVLKGGDDIFTTLQKHDLLLHHPYDSFSPVVDFIRTAAADPQVLAIKQTLYRIGRNSPIVEALIEAAEEGKQVAVLVELKARFDEENNIQWARALEQAGVHVVYGVVGLKTHGKVAMVIRKERDELRRYVHLGTGNYNPSTARGYTDVSFFTSRPDIGADVTELFNSLTGYALQSRYRKLLVAPYSLRKGLIDRIEREVGWQQQGKGGFLIFKVNSLIDPEIMRALYRASQAGVKIQLIVRGMCCLRPGAPEVSETIQVISITGRFLEHSRIFYFGNGGAPEVYLGSADLMPRNLDRRVEVVYPVEDPQLQHYILTDMLSTLLADTVNAHLLRTDGSYCPVVPQAGQPPLDSHLWFLTQPTPQQVGQRAPQQFVAPLVPSRRHKHRKKR